jgi:hypothetical protein
MTERDPWDLLDPGACLSAISDLAPFGQPGAILGLLTPEEQSVRAATTLWDRPPHDTLERTAVTEEAIRRLGLKDYEWADFRHRPIVVPVIVVDGPCWWSIDVDEVLMGLRYANNRFQTLTANPHVVNRHGWYDAFTKGSGTTPSASFSPRRRARRSA